MKETQTLEQFTITRDGELDPSFVRQQRVEALQAALGTAANTFTSIVYKGAEMAGKVALLSYANVYDSISETNYAEQLRDRWPEFGPERNVLV
jgi:hypothetical protein